MTATAERLTAVCTARDCGAVFFVDTEHVCRSRVPVALTPRVRKVSPCCSAPLDGGPVVFWCTDCGKDVHGSVARLEVAGRRP